ncbi:Biopolymer transport protein ExbB [Pirellula sp. SH-Sr6A]|nr:Biopolymer transport protein ExbB [Pirellula sp. SH-Sr6A]
MPEIPNEILLMETIQHGAARLMKDGTIMRSPLRSLLLAIAFFLSGAAIGLSQVTDRELQDLAGAASVKPQETGSTDSKQVRIDLLSLLVSGGFLMIPIGLVSLVVVAFTVDRLIGLRMGRLYPRKLRRSLRQYAKQVDVDPRSVHLCVVNDSSSAGVAVRSLLGRVGRSPTEMKSSVEETLQREADRAYGNVRWLNLSAGIAPLLGLLGTVWGLIRAFHDTTQLTAGQNRADALAVGIYEALVTTLAGLVVAIPAAVISHYFEGRITRVFGTIEEDVEALIPRFEGFEGRTRFETVGKELVPRDVATHRVYPPAIPSIPST